MLGNRLTSMGDEGRVFGSDGKDYMNTKRDMVLEWKPMPTDAAEELIEKSAVYKYGKQKIVTQTFVGGDDNWAPEGKSWHWQPVMADDIYESKGK